MILLSRFCGRDVDAILDLNTWLHLYDSLDGCHQWMPSQICDSYTYCNSIHYKLCIFSFNYSNNLLSVRTCSALQVFCSF